MPTNISDETFPCRDCGVTVTWATAKSGKRYLAQPITWTGEEYGARRVYFPSHRCTATPEQKAAREAERIAKREAREALHAAGVVAPVGRVRGIEATIVKIADKGEGQFKMTAATSEGWSVWVTVPKAFVQWTSYTKAECTLAVGQRVVIDATLKQSDRDPLFAFGSMPKVVAA